MSASRATMWLISALGVSGCLQLTVDPPTGDPTPLAIVAQLQLPEDERGTHDLSVADVNGDGADDIVTGGIDSGGTLDLHFGSGDDFILAADALPDGLGVKAIELFDVDGDACPELAIGLSSNEVRIFPNTGLDEPPFDIAAAFDLPLDCGPGTGMQLLPMSIAAGDFDDDGDLDLAVAHQGASTWVYENIGGTLGCGWVLDARGDRVLAIDELAFGRLGSRTVLAAAASFARFNTVFAAGSAAGAHDIVWSQAFGSDSFAVAWADIDGDGDRDLVFAGRGPDFVFEVDSETISDTAVVFDTAPGRATTMAAIDVDLDGDDELLIGGGNTVDPIDDPTTSGVPSALPLALWRSEAGTLREHWSLSSRVFAGAIAVSASGAEPRAIVGVERRGAGLRFDSVLQLDATVDRRCSAPPCE